MLSWTPHPGRAQQKKIVAVKQKQRDVCLLIFARFLSEAIADTLVHCRRRHLGPLSKSITRRPYQTFGPLVASLDHLHIRQRQSEVNADDGMKP